MRTKRSADAQTHKIARRCCIASRSTRRTACIATCVDPAQAPAELAGRWYDASFLEDLPARVDPCGENGEFHTFVVDGPGFRYPLDVTVGEIVQPNRFVFADVVPMEHSGGRGIRTHDDTSVP